MLSNNTKNYGMLYRKRYDIDLTPVTAEYRDKLKGNIPDYDSDIPSGNITINKVDRSNYRIVITASGLPPNGIFSFENVTKMTPHTTTPLLTRGFNGFVSDCNGFATTVLNTKTKPGLIILVNYHTGNDYSMEDGSLSKTYPAILGGLMPYNLD